MANIARIGVLTCVLLGAAAVPASVSATAMAAPAPVTITIVAGNGTGSSLQAQKSAVDKALAQAADLYEGASTAVQKATADYVKANAELPGAQQALISANGAVIAANADLQTANANVVSTQQASAAASGAELAANARVDAERADIAGVVTSVYEGSAFLRVGALLTDGAPGTVINRFATANQVVVAQQQTLNQYIAARMTAKDALNTADAAVTAATKAQAGAASALAASEHTKALAAGAQANVTALIASRKAALAVAMKNKASMLKQYQQLQSQEKSVESALAKQAAADKKAAAKKAKTKSGGSKSTPTQYKGGRQGYFLMPVHGWMSSPFGMRFDPIYKRWQLHAGVDIAVGTGTPIHAARAGRVIRAGWDGGYGNYTCIDTGLYEGSGADHGKDIANCYAHQSRILVHVGEHISLGQTIGLVGMTGAATGPHLHFEVRIDGTPVQPLNWLPKCFC
jgi:murein DD-endopeptidase MepM/ murein hydrolase activator NlpD